MVAKDASLLRHSGGRPRTGDYVYNYPTTNQLEVGPGESMDAIFTAPARPNAAAHDSYLLYDRNYAYASNGGAAGKPGGMVTEIRIYPDGTLARPAVPQPDQPEGGVRTR